MTQVEALMNLSANWDGNGALAPTAEALATAKETYVVLVRTPNGGISVEVRHGEQAILIYAYRIGPEGGIHGGVPLHVTWTDLIAGKI
jgi:hypothetical protein